MSTDSSTQLEFEFIDNSPKLLVKTGIMGQFSKAHRVDAGYDILCAKGGDIKPLGATLFDTDLYVSIPEGYVGFIKSRSGLAVKHNLEVGAGVIDSGYTGEVKVLIRNFGNTTYSFCFGDKIAQLVVIPIFMGVEVETFELPDTKRGDKGFNSTGYNNGIK